MCAAAAFGKWNVLRPISLLDIKDVKPTPKEHDGREERRRRRKVLSHKNKINLHYLPVGDQTKVEVQVVLT